MKKNDQVKHSVLIIAEAGVNHNGDMRKAKELIDVAADAGADFVKFQTFKADRLVAKDAKKASYQVQNEPEQSNDQYTMLKSLELSEDDHMVLSRYAQSRNIGFLSTGFDEESIDFLNDSLNIPFFKVPSGEITNKPYLQHLAKKGKPVILSTGMADMEEVRAAVNVLINGGLKKSSITLLHCNTEYPTPMEDVNLMAMLSMKKDFEIEVGYSDHTLGIEVPIAAVALGARVIEKHFTLDRNMPGPDHKASLEPMELRAMVMAVRNIEKAIGGSGIKSPSQSEVANKVAARKSIHIKQSVGKGAIITRENIVMKRPGDGISPMDVDLIIGKKVVRDIAAGNKIIWKDLDE
ncbi:N-acetylneuraminate synthase [Fulvivirga imtechensis AK7]|uniref:N-acetylneuraminate synthase n=1 Tax=Fulvivirga imtechensis AK7 TaxID=1237149 RepID=L8JTD3_9BACT|nr:N-acetylneuraminate synthase [Fulvivirga imtechensis]ELR70602.1 N-acetylneuraminate synthase [Fulvivirga imtechensis AK7]